MTSFGRRLEHFSQLPELRPMTFVRSSVGARSLSTSLSTKTLVQSAIHRPPRAHWLSWSGGGEQGQTRHRGPVFKKAPTARARPQNWRGEIAHARGAGSFCVMCSRDTSCPQHAIMEFERVTYSPAIMQVQDPTAKRNLVQTSHTH